MLVICVSFFFFKQKTAYEMRISDWSSDVYASDLVQVDVDRAESAGAARFDHGAGFLDALDAVDRLLHRRVEVLHAEAGAVEADVGHAGDVGGRAEEIGRAPCREGVWQYVSISGVVVSSKKKYSKKETQHEQ